MRKIVVMIVFFIIIISPGFALAKDVYGATVGDKVFYIDTNSIIGWEQEFFISNIKVIDANSGRKYKKTIQINFEWDTNLGAWFYDLYFDLVPFYTNHRVEDIDFISEIFDAAYPYVPHLYN